MGEVRTRRIVASSLVMLLVLLVPVSAEENDSVSLQIETLDDNSKPWYGVGDSVIVSSSILNDGVATSITEDPSCGTVMIITDSDNEIVVDESAACRGQSRGLDIASGVTPLEQHQWDLSGPDGLPVSPGQYTMTVELAGSELSASKDIMVQQNANIPSELVFSTSLTHRDGALSIGEPMVVAFELHNPTSNTIDLSSLDACHLLIEFEQPLLGPTCSASTDVIDAYSVVSLGHTLFQPSVVGETSLTVQTPDGILIDAYDLVIEERIVSETPLQTTINSLSTAFIQGELFDGSLSLENEGQESELLRFTNTCRVSYWVADAMGSVVFDTLDQSNCREAELDVVVGPSSQSTFPLQSWAFVDELGCSIRSGDYVLIAEVPEFGYASSMDLDFRRTQSSNCATTVAPLTSLSIQNDGSGTSFELQLTGMGEQTDIQWLEICKATVQLWNLDLTEKVVEKNVLCNEDERVDESLRIASGDVLSYSLDELADYAYEEAEYRVRIDLATDQNLIVEEEFTWPINQEVEDVEVVEEEPEVEGVVTQIDGTWSGVLTADGTCWMLENEDGTIHMLAESAMTDWSPQRGTNGAYEAQQSVANDACSRFTAESYTLLSILLETPLVEEEVVVEETNIVETEEVESQAVPDWAPQAVTVLTVSAILSMLGFAAFNNEAIRISTTLTGLWLLGLIGRTSETSDGRFQRGRLLGYLTANPGCHFRALLSALEMSNGQLSHHLRVLEQEESIWRRKDGRLVRYYPLTNTLHPLLEDDALPVPILAPDPLSLQGKILVLLDHDSQMGDFPTQAELAKRLDKSQQLISHHLRTLEKYGLIEGRRMGMRNRYKLTKEAMFLLETSEAYVQNEMNL